VTADTGENPVLIIWDVSPHLGHHIGTPAASQNPTPTPMSAGATVLNALPIRTIFDVHEGTGVIAAEFSADSKYLFTLGNGKLYNSERKLFCTDVSI
jgi:hypothetical protein